MTFSRFIVVPVPGGIGRPTERREQCSRGEFALYNPGDGPYCFSDKQIVLQILCSELFVSASTQAGI
jgi:hypothetical protein